MYVSATFDKTAALSEVKVLRVSLEVNQVLHFESLKKN
jgi:hypothetical protein